MKRRLSIVICPVNSVFRLITVSDDWEAHTAWRNGQWRCCCCLERVSGGNGRPGGSSDVTATNTRQESSHPMSPLRSALVTRLVCGLSVEFVWIRVVLGFTGSARFRRQEISLPKVCWRVRTVARRKTVNSDLLLNFVRCNTVCIPERHRTSAEQPNRLVNGSTGHQDNNTQQQAAPQAYQVSTHHENSVIRSSNDGLENTTTHQQIFLRYKNILGRRLRK